jgi:hypothetical protein
MSSDLLIPLHRGYRDLKSYQMVEIIHDGVVTFATALSRSNGISINDSMVQQ